ncbi:F-box protein At3g56470 [Helianthus annuus]|nr:F-box protein At3g56470 [Helianthus annuus]
MELKQISCDESASYESLIAENRDENETKIDNTSESHLLSIPLHILEMVMEHFRDVEFMNFRATCKHCYLAAPLRRPQMSSPWLLVLRKNHDIISLIDPMCGDEYVVKTPRELLHSQCSIICSRYGWLLMLNNRGHIHELVFCNPFTGKIRKLPSAKPCSFGSLCFSAPPTSPDCIVVGFTTHGPYHVYIHFMSREPPSWRRYRWDDYGNDPHSDLFPTFSGRSIYALCNNGRVDAFSFSDRGKGDYSLKVVKVEAPTRPRANFYLSKCDQHLLLVIVGEYGGESVEVFKLNDSTKEWEKINDLGKHMIYISETSCICLDAKSPQMGNKIYFPRYHKNDTKAKSPQTGNNIYFPRLLDNSNTKIVFYSLETRRYHTFDDKNIQESCADLLGMSQPCNPHTWIE